MSKGVTWFKMFLSFAPLINAIPSENVGEGMKAAMKYFKTGEVPEDNFPEMSSVIYTTLKDSIDQAFIDCEEKSEKARKSVMVRWQKEDTTEYDRIRPNTEKKRIRREEKIEEERRGEENTTTTDSKYTGPGESGAGGGLSPEILEYAREKARGAKNPAAYEAAILDRIQKEGYKTIEEVISADKNRRRSPYQGTGYHQYFDGETVV